MEGNQFQALLGATGSGKTFTMANIMQQLNKPTLVIAHNKTLAINTIKKYFEKSIERYKKLVFVEKEFGVTFAPKDLLQNEGAWIDLEEIYLTLKEKEIIRLNAKVNDTEAAGMKVSQQADKIKVGDALDINFFTNLEYFLWNITITLFAASLLSNAIVKK